MDSKAQQDAEAAYAARVPGEPRPAEGTGAAKPRRRSLDLFVEHLRKAAGLTDTQSAKLGHIRRNTIYACAMLRADKLAGLPIRAYKKGRAEGRVLDLRDPRQRIGLPPARIADVGTATMLESSPVLDLLSRPNADWTGRVLIRMTEISLCVAGEAFWWLSGWRGRVPAEISYVKDDRMEVIKATTTDQERTVAGWLLDGMTAGEKKLAPEEVLWFRYPDLESPEYGALSPADVSVLGADSYRDAMQSNRDIFRKALRANGVFLPPEGQGFLDAAQVHEVERDIELLMKGAQNNHAAPVIPYPLKWQDMNLTPRDAEFAALLDFAIEDTARAFRVPVEKIGGVRKTYRNVSEAERVLWLDALVPEAEWFAEELTHRLLPLFPQGMVDFVAFDLSGVDALSEGETERWTRYQTMWKMGVPLNMILAQESMPEVSWGDAWWAPLALTPVTDEGQATPMTPTDKVAAAEAEESGRGRAAKPQQSGGDLRAMVETFTTPRRAEDDYEPPEFGSDEHVRIMRASDAAKKPHEEAITVVVRKLFERQRDSLLSQLKNQRAARLALADVAKMFNRARWIREFRVAILPDLRETYDTGVGVAAKDIGETIAFSSGEPRAVRFLRRRAQRFATEVNAWTWEVLKDSLSEGIKGGESIPELADRVESVMGTRIRSSPETIARTEVLGAIEGGAQQYAEEVVKELGIEVRKVWLSASDERVRETHIAAHGQTRALDEDFSVGGCSGPAPGLINCVKEVVNCRCIATRRRVRRAVEDTMGTTATVVQQAE